MSIISFSLPLIVVLSLSEGGLQAQPLMETYKRQESLRISIEKTCQTQFEKAQYDGQVEDLQYMISSKGVQGIKAAVVPTRAGGSYKCDRGEHEQPMLLGRTYTSRLKRQVNLPPAYCNKMVETGVLAPSECANVRRERLELEHCVINPIGKQSISTSCLTSYVQLDDGLVDKKVVAFRRMEVDTK